MSLSGGTAVRLSTSAAWFAAQAQKETRRLLATRLRRAPAPSCRERIARSATPFSCSGGHAAGTLSGGLDALVGEHLTKLAREELARVVALDVDDLDRAAPRGRHRVNGGQKLVHLHFSYVSDLFLSMYEILNRE